MAQTAQLGKCRCCETMFWPFTVPPGGTQIDCVLCKQYLLLLIPGHITQCVCCGPVHENMMRTLQDDDWGSPAEPKASSGSKRRHPEADAPDGAPATAAVAEAVVGAEAAAIEAAPADDAPAEKRQKVRALSMPYVDHYAAGLPTSQFRRFRQHNTACHGTFVTMTTPSPLPDMPTQEECHPTCSHCAAWRR